MKKSDHKHATNDFPPLAWDSPLEPVPQSQEEAEILFSLVECLVKQWVGQPKNNKDVRALIGDFLRIPLPGDCPETMRVDHAFSQAFVWMVTKEFHGDVITFLHHYIAKEGTMGTLFQGHFAEGTVNLTRYKWQVSFLGLAHYRQKGEKRVLQFLPRFFLEDFFFFLEHPWIQELLSEWHHKGEEDKFHHAFFGTAKGNATGKGRGKRHLQTLREKRIRQLKLVEQVNRLKAEGVGLNEAIRRVQTELAAARIVPRVSFPALKKDYYSFNSNADPFTDLFSFPSD